MSSAQKFECTVIKSEVEQPLILFNVAVATATAAVAAAAAAASAAASAASDN